MPQGLIIGATQSNADTFATNNNDLSDDIIMFNFLLLVVSK